MVTSENQEKEFIIPTKYKIQIGSYLSWPFGAAELTKAFLTVPQIKELQLMFYESLPKYPKGKWPGKFRIIEARYGFHRGSHPMSEVGWSLSISPVPRNMRAEIKEAFNLSGFKRIAEWLIEHAEYSGREGNLSYTGAWNSETKEVVFGNRDYVLPDVSVAKQQNQK